ncbi:phosphate ABC transporter substrate-binding protein PstS [Paracraurococcus lichenis]|uniref:Phosphate-binding protein PstS n=1 Tax=Paracraurococcus lichenis TaxID=3064888 RepID=A0ABT9DZT2_9PROT|nr:phosphate ABC transporter substrate-binding protein PstS [Paracraurococcus sp. LOR1-02]MDO9709411.1 phosphate ABC transporter substrate-binding protein PstS [Paracraurococcus sp. LOR1-02]
MNRRSLLIATGAAAAVPLLGRPAFAQQAQITGAGASFPRPVYERWGQQAREAAGVQLNYQSIGSGGGINQITNRTVDFGASDAPLPAAQLTERSLLQFPTVMGSVVLIVNLPGVADNALRLTPEVLADLFLGKIGRWNDARVAELNRDLRLPNLPVAPVYRADASGTTFVFTTYLSRVSEAWKSGPGAATSVQWPGGQGARGNEGVANTVRNTPGAIGYTENAYATVNKLVTTQLRNKSGAFVKPEMANFIAAAESADWNAPNFAADLIDLGGANVWPIVAPTFILLPTNPAADRVQGSLATMKFFDWAYRNGAEAARRLEYIPLPEAVAERIRQAWKGVKGPNGQAVWTA